MSAATIPIVPFVRERFHDLRHIVQLHPSQHPARGNDVVGKKRKHGCTTRTGSIRSYKIPKLRKNSKHRRKLIGSRLNRRCQRGSAALQLSLNQAYMKCVLPDEDHRINRLNTHLWHTKRMKMCNMFGYSLPERNSSVGRKFVLEAVQRGCVLHDKSYWKALTIRAKSLPAMLQLLESHLDPALDTEEWLESDCDTSARELDALFYHAESFPADLIGPVWLSHARSGQQPPRKEQQHQQQQQQQSDHIEIRLWVHPAAIGAVLKTLQHTCAILRESTTGSPVAASPSKAFSKPGRNPMEESVEVLPRAEAALPHLMNRFSIRGAGCTAVVLQVLHRLKQPPQEGVTFDDSIASRGVPGGDEHRRGDGGDSDPQSKFLVQALTSAASLNTLWRHGQVLCLNSIADPRCTYPMQRIGSIDHNNNTHPSPSCMRSHEKAKRLTLKWPISRGAATCPLWNNNFQALNAIQGRFKPDSRLNDEKNEFRQNIWREKVHSADAASRSSITDFSRALWEGGGSINSGSGSSGSADASEKSWNVVNTAARDLYTSPAYSSASSGLMETFPVVVVRKQDGFGRGGSQQHQPHPCTIGFDLIVAASWGRTIWKALSFGVPGQPTVAAGQREMEALHRSTPCLSYPRDFVDTSAGEKFWECVNDALREKNRGRPWQKCVWYRDILRVLAWLHVKSTAQQDQKEKKEGDEEEEEEEVVVGSKQLLGENPDRIKPASSPLVDSEMVSGDCCDAAVLEIPFGTQQAGTQQKVLQERAAEGAVHTDRWQQHTTRELCIIPRQGCYLTDLQLPRASKPLRYLQRVPSSSTPGSTTTTAAATTTTTTAASALAVGNELHRGTKSRENNHAGALLTSLDFVTLLHVSVRSLGRGLPRDAAVLFALTETDWSEWLTANLHRVSGQKNRGEQWKGVKVGANLAAEMHRCFGLVDINLGLTDSETGSHNNPHETLQQQHEQRQRREKQPSNNKELAGRRVVGVVTSGYAARTNADSSGALGVANVLLLHQAHAVGKGIVQRLLQSSKTGTGVSTVERFTTRAIGGGEKEGWEGKGRSVNGSGGCARIESLGDTKLGGGVTRGTHSVRIPDGKVMLLFHNPRSNWLRPALVNIMHFE